MALSIMDPSLEGGIFSGKMLLVGGMWRAKLIHAGTLEHVQTDKVERTHDEGGDIWSVFPLWNQMMKGNISDNQVTALTLFTVEV